MGWVVVWLSDIADAVSPTACRAYGTGPFARLTDGERDKR